MRFRLDDEAWTCGRMFGQWEFIEVEKSGQWKVKCQLQIKDDTAYVYAETPKPYHSNSIACNTEPAHNHDQCLIGTENPFPQGRDSHWRLCYARELATSGEAAYWRLRDERTGELWFVSGYDGTVNVNWADGGSHCFVDGPVSVDENKVAHFR